jgi:hypothetical protein
MKYLKKFENNSISKDEIQYHLDDILSIFQEYIDEYDIENLNLLKKYQNNDRHGLYYSLDFYATDYKIKKIYFRFTTYVIADNTEKNLITDKFLEFTENKPKIISTLNSFGYDCITHFPFPFTIDIEDCVEYQFRISYQF